MRIDAHKEGYRNVTETMQFAVIGGKPFMKGEKGFSSEVIFTVAALLLLALAFTLVIYKKLKVK